jgi:hypothetical protein
MTLFEQFCKYRNAFHEVYRNGEVKDDTTT